MQINFGTIIHIANTIHDFLNLMNPKKSEQGIYLDIQIHLYVEDVKIFILVLNSRFILDLKNTFCIPSFSRNLVSISKLANVGFVFHFENYIFNIFKNKNVVSASFLWMVYINYI